MRLEEVESRLKDSEYKEEARSEMKVSRGGEREVARRKEKGRWHVHRVCLFRPCKSGLWRAVSLSGARVHTFG